MAHQITYTCDRCKKPITELYGPLLVTIRSATEPQVNEDLELCGFKCLAVHAGANGGLGET